VVVVELQGQLLVRERELDSKEYAITVWEDGLVASEHALGKVCMKHDVVMSELRPSSRTSLPSRAPLVLGPNGSLTSTGHWRNTRSSFSYRRWTWRCKR
jgi:hypothetical protein